MTWKIESNSSLKTEVNEDASIELTHETVAEKTDDIGYVDFERNPEKDSSEITEDPSDNWTRDELELLKAGESAIKLCLEAREDDYHDKGLSETEVAEKIAADKWRFQQEFLQDAFSGQDVSPNVFNGLFENGAKDRLKEIENSPELQELIRENGERTIEKTEDEFIDFYQEFFENSEKSGAVEGQEYIDFKNYDEDAVKEAEEETKLENEPEIEQLEDITFDEETNVQYEGLADLSLEQSTEIREAIDEMGEEYPELKDIPIHVEVTDDLEEGTFAAAAPLIVDNRFEAIVKINRQEFDETLDDRLEEYEQKGFFAASGSKTVIKHELGHILQLKLDATSVELEPGESVEDVRNREKFNEMIEKWNSNEHTDRILSQALYNLSLCNSDIPRELSMYAATNSAEALAEAVSEVSTSEHPRRLAVEIVKEYQKLKEELEETTC